MSEKQETVADLLEELRSGEYAPLADRIEAAHKRERDANVQSDVQKIGHNLDNSTIGNVLKMREALIAIKREIDGYCYNGESLLTRMTEDPPDYTCLRDSILEINKLINAALAAPARNCDVGTVEEQCVRYRHFCRQHAPCDNGNCPLRVTCDCQFTWAQMPYEEGGAK